MAWFCISRGCECCSHSISIDIDGSCWPSYIIIDISNWNDVVMYGVDSRIDIRITIDSCMGWWVETSEIRNVPCPCPCTQQRRAVHMWKSHVSFMMIRSSDFVVIVPSLHVFIIPIHVWYRLPPHHVCSPLRYLLWDWVRSNTMVDWCWDISITCTWDSYEY